MKVQEVYLENNKKRYMVIDDNGFPIVPVVKYLKYLVSTGKSINTQKSYSYALKHYFEYLGHIKKCYSHVTLQDLAYFVAWLRNPYECDKAIPLGPVDAKRCEKTINHTITVVTGFYDYLYRNNGIENDYIEKIVKQVYLGGKRKYYNFLFHIDKNKPIEKNILKLKTPRKKLKTLTKQEVMDIYSSCTNIRDKFLIKLLFETGLRIGEAMSLFIEDFKFDLNNGHKIKLTDRGELPNGAKLKTGEREIHVSQELMNLFDDYMYKIIDELELDTNFVFIKLKGMNIGQPMEYDDVASLMKRLRRKTKINMHAHLLRHTHATIYYKQTKDIKQVQERLGHAQIQTTTDIYVHPSEEDIREGWKTAQSAFEFNPEIYEGEKC